MLSTLFGIKENFQYFTNILGNIVTLKLFVDAGDFATIFKGEHYEHYEHLEFLTFDLFIK